MKYYAEENILSFKLGMLMNTLKRIALTFEEVLTVHCLWDSEGRFVPTVGERSNFKKNPTHTQDHGDA